MGKRLKSTVLGKVLYHPSRGHLSVCNMPNTHWDVNCTLPLHHVGVHEGRNIRWWGDVMFPADKRFR